ncbi:protein kinase-like protein [Klebsiella pneumoniae]|uniref:Protein kinase-like protein n=1 Tax=Klebsiella pneumoniae TaxID=573 RepID=A0A2X3EK57_KLEPN|nr:protein kinase-like protein [Klebsiella pneumoniae]
MWQAISTLLRDWHTEDAEIELKTELPGGEIHSAWHLRFGGKDYFVKCDERELLPIFTAESDQLELLSRSKTVRVPQVFAVGSDRDYSFVVMEYLPPRPLDAHNAFLLGQQLAHLHQWSDQPQFGLDFDNDLSTTPQPNAWQRRWSVFLPSSVSAAAGARGGEGIALWRYRYLSRYGTAATGQPSAAAFAAARGSVVRQLRLRPDGPYIFDPACYWGDRECDLAMLPMHPEQPPQIYDGYQSVSPLPSGFLDRQPIYQLYTLLNRAILFGGQHLVTAQQALDDVLMEKMR